MVQPPPVVLKKSNGWVMALAVAVPFLVVGIDAIAAVVVGRKSELDPEALYGRWVCASKNEFQLDRDGTGFIRWPNGSGTRITWSLSGSEVTFMQDPPMMSLSDTYMTSFVREVRDGALKTKNATTGITDSCAPPSP